MSSSLMRYDTGPQDNDDPEYYGVIQRSAACLYEKTRQNQDFRCKIRMSYLEIYNERVLDLLNHTEQVCIEIVVWMISDVLEPSIEIQY